MGFVDASLQALRRLAVGLTALGAVCALLMMLHVTADVVGRYAFNHPVHATLEVVEHIYMVCLAFLPIALVQVDREHLVIELFIRDAHGIAGRIATLFSTLIALAICGLIAEKTIEIAVEKTRIAEAVYLVDSLLPVWWVRWVIAAAFTLCTLILLLQLVQDLARLAGRQPAVPAAGDRPAPHPSPLD